MSRDETLTLKEAAEEAGVSPATLKRWAERGLIPGVGKKASAWSPAAVAHARIVARLRARGHSLDQIRQASREGRLAYGFIEELIAPHTEPHSVDDAASE